MHETQHRLTTTTTITFILSLLESTKPSNFERNLQVWHLGAIILVFDFSLRSAFRVKHRFEFARRLSYIIVRLVSVEDCDVGERWRQFDGVLIDATVFFVTNARDFETNVACNWTPSMSVVSGSTPTSRSNAVCAQE
jgi:hypothetical protein